MVILDALRAAGALILVLGILLGFAWLLRRYGGSLGLRTGQAASDLSVVEWRTLDMRRKLAVIRWDGRDHLLCLGPVNDLLIAQRPAPAATAAATPPAANDETAT